MVTTASHDSAPDKMLPTAPLPRYGGHLALMDGQGPVSREWQARDHNRSLPFSLAGTIGRPGPDLPFRPAARGHTGRTIAYLISCGGRGGWCGVIFRARLGVAVARLERPQRRRVGWSGNSFQASRRRGRIRIRHRRLQRGHHIDRDRPLRRHEAKRHRPRRLKIRHRGIPRSQIPLHGRHRPLRRLCGLAAR